MALLYDYELYCKLARGSINLRQYGRVIVGLGGLSERDQASQS